MSTNDLESRPHALYRFFGAGGTLLYIGLTVDLPTRVTDHRDGKPWWTGVAKITVENFPDRPTVVEAERRAIIAEKPLYNVQHNRAQPAAVETTSKKRDPRRGRFRLANPRRDWIEPVCQGCKWPVAGSARAVIHVLMKDVYDYSAKYRDWESRVREQNQASGVPSEIGMLLTRSQLFECPDPVPWQIHCDDCNPHKDAYGKMCGGCYWFSLDRCKTHGDLLRWTAHLVSKVWFRDTRWEELIYKLTPNVVEP